MTAPYGAAAPRPARPGRPSRGGRNGRFRAWLDHRLGLSDLADALLGGTMPGGASLWHTLGSVAAGLVVVEVVTGTFLATAYSPSVTTAWASVAYIQDRMTLGWFVRGLHSFGSSALIVVSGLHLLQVVLFGAYRRPREVNWMVGLALMGVTLLFALSGYLLPWDQKGYWAKLVEATITGSAPVLGPALQKVVQGGSSFGNLTLTRAFATHAMALPALLAALIALHVYLYRRHGPTPKWTITPETATARAVPFWPEQAALNAAMGALVVVLVTLVVASSHGAALESPADPASSYLARPEWYAVPLYQLRMYFEGPLEIVATLIIPGVAAIVAFALPFLDRGRSNAPSARKPVMVGLIVAIGSIGALAMAARAKDAANPAFAKARAEEQAKAEHARRLAREGVPPEGGLAVFRNDPMYRARGVWEERCAGCHSLTGAGGEKGPDLKGYNTRAWIKGFLQDPNGPLYMGPAKLDSGMKPVDYVTPAEMDALVEYVYAETGAADADPTKASAGRDLLSPKDCDTCHDFDGSSENDGPNLKGRGTARWVAAVIADASHPLLFGDRNKMTKFKTRLTPAEIEDLSKFVRSLGRP
jgi:ubiquinol-cytochrome c reductase cytochrome b subunit